MKSVWFSPATAVAACYPLRSLLCPVVSGLLVPPQTGTCSDTKSKMISIGLYKEFSSSRSLGTALEYDHKSAVVFEVRPAQVDCHCAGLKQYHFAQVVLCCSRLDTSYGVPQGSCLDPLILTFCAFPFDDSFQT